MGREIRKVPKNHEHKQDSEGNYINMSSIEDYDKYYKSMTKENWIEENGDDEGFEYITDPINYHSTGNSYQLYQNTGEGTPLSPAFETKQELKEWLMINVDFWNDKWGESSIDAILNNGFAMTGIMTGGKMYRPHEQGEII